LNLHTKHYTEN